MLSFDSSKENLFASFKYWVLFKYIFKNGKEFKYLKAKFPRVSDEKKSRKVFLWILKRLDGCHLKNFARFGKNHIANNYYDILKKTIDILQQYEPQEHPTRTWNAI